MLAGSQAIYNLPMNLSSLSLITGILLAQWDNPSARIMGLGSGFTYLVPDTLTDMLINPANTPKVSMVIAKPYPFPQAGAFCRGFGVWARPDKYTYDYDESWDTSQSYWCGEVVKYSNDRIVSVDGIGYLSIRARDFGLSFLIDGCYDWSWHHNYARDSDSVLVDWYTKSIASSDHRAAVNLGWRIDPWEFSVGFVWEPRFRRETEFRFMDRTDKTSRDLPVTVNLTGRLLRDWHGSFYFQILTGPGDYRTEGTSDEPAIHFDYWRYGLSLGMASAVSLWGGEFWAAAVSRNWLDWNEDEIFRMSSRLEIPLGLERNWKVGSLTLKGRGGYGPYLYVTETTYFYWYGDIERFKTWDVRVSGRPSAGLSLSWGTSSFDLYNTGNLTSIGDWRAEFWKTF